METLVVLTEIEEILEEDNLDELNLFLEHPEKKLKIRAVLDSATYITALHIAVRKDAINCLRKLLEIVPKNLIDSPTHHGFTPLHIAAKKANKNAIEILLEKGACPNVRLENGNSPLHLVLLELEKQNVSKEEVKNCMEVLIGKLETDLDAVNVNKATPIELLNRIGKKVDITELSTILPNLSRSRSTSAKFYDCLARNEKDASVWNEILTNDRETVKALASGFYGPNRILYHVVPNTVAMEFFLDKLNVNPAIENLNGTIPLHKSLSYNNYEATDILIKKMANNPCSKDQRNRSFSLITTVIEFWRKDAGKCLKRLLNGEIILDINQVTKGSTETALDYAARKKNQEAMDILIEHGGIHGLM